MSDCCQSIFTAAVPGPAGAAGAAGTNGTDGVSSYTTVANYSPSAQPIMPQPIRHLSVTTVLGSTTVTTASTALLSAGDGVFGAGLSFGVSSIASVTDATHFELATPATASATNTWTFQSYVTVDITTSNVWASVGEPIYVQSWGIMFVVSKPTATSLRFSNPEDATNGFYLANANAGLSLPAGYVVSPGGAQGPAGAAGSGAFLVANNLSEGVAATVRTNLALGSVATFAQGNGDTAVPRVDLGGGLVAGRAVFATAAGVETKTAAAAVSAIGAQPTDALLTAIAALVTVADRTIYTTGVDTVALTTLTAYMRTVLAAIDAPTARGLLGVSVGSTFDYMLYQQQSAATVDGAVCALGAWNTAPLNTEVVDEGNHGSIVANTVTLAAGTYRYRFSGVTANCNVFQARLFNSTTATPVGYGQSAGSVVTVNTNFVSAGEGVFTIAVPNNFRIEIFCSATGTFGTAGNSGGPEIYATLAFIKE